MMHEPQTFDSDKPRPPQSICSLGIFDQLHEPNIKTRNVIHADGLANVSEAVLPVSIIRVNVTKCLITTWSLQRAGVQSNHKSEPGQECVVSSRPRTRRKTC